jgi:MFS family permease
MNDSGPGRLGRPFTLLWTAGAVSALGDGVRTVAIPLLVASLTSSPLIVSGTMFATFLPWLLFALVSGGVVDRLDRRRVMVAVDVMRAAAVGLLGASVAFGRISLVALYGVAFLLSTGETLFRAAHQVIVASLVPRDLLERANARLSLIPTVMHSMIAGPVGGVLFAVAAAAPFLVDAGSFAASAVLLLLIPGTFRSREPAAIGDAAAERTSLRTEILAGLRWLLAHRLLRTLALLIGLLNITLVAAMSVLVLLAQQRLGLNAVGYGLLFTALSVGGLVGALFGERLVRRFTASVTLRAGLIVETAFHLVMAVSASPIPVGIAFAAFGVHGALWTIVATSIQQRLTPRVMLGRVASATLFLVAGGNAFGALLGGLIATRFGLTAPYWIGFVVAAVVTAATWRVFDRKTIAEAYAPTPVDAPAD